LSEVFDEAVDVTGVFAGRIYTRSEVAVSTFRPAERDAEIKA
jgi:hypothetical protein